MMNEVERAQSRKWSEEDRGVSIEPAEHQLHHHRSAMPRTSFRSGFWLLILALFYSRTGDALEEPGQKITRV
jgi:hypothetical protein